MWTFCSCYCSMHEDNGARRRLLYGYLADNYSSQESIHSQHAVSIHTPPWFYDPFHNHRYHLLQR